MCFLQSNVSRKSARTFAPRGLCDPSINNLLFLIKFLSLPFLISCNLATLFILVIPFFICSSEIFTLKFLNVAIAVEILDNWKSPIKFGYGNFKLPNSSS